MPRHRSNTTATPVAECLRIALACAALSALPGQALAQPVLTPLDDFALEVEPALDLATWPDDADDADDAGDAGDADDADDVDDADDDDEAPAPPVPPGPPPPPPPPEPPHERHGLPHERHGLPHERHPPPHERHGHHHRPPAHGAPPTKPVDHREHMLDPTGVSHTRMGSGTSWQPESSPMYALMAPIGRGGLMFNLDLKAGFDWFSSDRGSSALYSTNSLSLVGWYPLGPFELQLRGMFSAEPWTVGSAGYPLILQTGEEFEGQPLVDRQHPHDLFMEVAGRLSLRLFRGFGVFLYAAPAGEPALGPTAFPHRVSANSDPFAPLSHHWQDSTHIAFGVLTAGVYTRHVKLEGSWFNGREPDEYRTNIELAVPDSWSGRLTVNPTDSLSFQASYGYLDSPETLHPDVSTHRITASATFNRRYGDEANFATTFAFGENLELDGGQLLPSHAFLLEHSWNINGHNVIFGRAEYVLKTGEDLWLPRAERSRAFHTGMIGLGYAHYFGPIARFMIGVGARGALGFIEPDLGRYYNTQFPFGGTVFLHVRPSAVDWWREPKRPDPGDGLPPHRDAPPHHRDEVPPAPPPPGPPPPPPPVPEPPVP